jgi:alpha-mannosidase
MAILPQCGEGIAERAAFASKAFQNPLLVQSEPADAHKFSGGRPAVQDTSIAELFYREIPYADVHMELKGHGITLDNDNLLITAFKKSYDRSGYILRFYNLKNHSVDTILKFGRLNISRVWKTNLRETVREELQILDNEISIHVKEKEIVTLFLK